MPLHHWLIYLSIVAAIIITPGPSAALCLTHGATQGSLRALATVVGGMVASLMLMCLSAIGLGAAIAASDTLFFTIKLLGAAYLVFLGISLWRAPPAVQERAKALQPLVNSYITPLSKLFSNGFMVGIGNPKDLLFFGALFPQFLNPSAPMIPQLSILAATWLVIDGSAMFGYATLGARLTLSLRRFGSGRLLNRITGSIFIAAGGALATAQK